MFGKSRPLFGYEGNDFLYGGNGSNDRMYGGKDNDTYFVTSGRRRWD